MNNNSKVVEDSEDIVLSLNSLLEKVNKSEISTIKQTVIHIIRTINDPDSSASDLKRIIELDPPLTSKLLKLANSALYGYQKTISGIQEAIVCIGFDKVRELALSQKVCEIFQNDDIVHGYSRARLWKKSIAVAICSKLIYRREFREKGNDIYVAGLLHDIGIIIVDQFLHERFLEVLKTAYIENRNYINIEEAILGVDHQSIGAELIKDWEMPDELYNAVRFHHDPVGVPDKYEMIVNVIYIANTIIQSKYLGYCDCRFSNDTLFRQSLSRMSIKDKGLELIIKETTEELTKLEKYNFL